MANPMKKVLRERKPHSDNSHLPVRFASSRKDTNDEIMLASLRKHDHVRLNVYVKIKSPDGGGYAGYHGTGITVNAPTIEAAKQFPGRLKSAIAKIAEELGMSLPGVVLVDRS